MGGVSNTINTIADLLNKNNGVRQNVRTQQLGDTVKTIGQELINNGLGNALRFFWKPQSFTPSWSKSVKDKKEIDDAMPKLLKKYGGYVFEYALSNNNGKSQIPNVSMLKRDILQEYGDLKLADNDFYKLFTLLRKSNTKDFNAIIPQDVTKSNFSQVRDRFLKLDEEGKTAFLDKASAQISYILKYWTTFSRSDDRTQVFSPAVQQFTANLRDLTKANIFDNVSLDGAKMIKMSLRNVGNSLLTQTKTQSVPLLNEQMNNGQIDNKLRDNILRNSIFYAMFTCIDKFNSLDINNILNVLTNDSEMIVPVKYVTDDETPQQNNQEQSQEQQPVNNNQPTEETLNENIILFLGYDKKKITTLFKKNYNNYRSAFANLVEGSIANVKNTDSSEEFASLLKKMIQK